jgi:hypothetical protein
MKLYFVKSGNGRFGGSFDAPLQYLHRVISDRFQAEGITFPYENIEITLSLPPVETKNVDERQQKHIDWYNKLPHYYRGKKMLIVYLSYSEKDENLTDAFRLTYAAFDIIGAKKKKNDNIDTEKIKLTLQQLEKELQTTDLWELHHKYKLLLRQETIELSRKDRMIREQSNDEKKRLIYDIRFMYHFENIGLKYFAPYNIEFCERILTRLREKKFRLPRYTHLYISCSDTFENALYHAIRGENWFVYGIAVLKNYADYPAKTEIEKQRIVFDLIKQGLMDIAKIDKLDIQSLNDVLNEVEQKYF